MVHLAAAGWMAGHAGVGVDTGAGFMNVTRTGKGAIARHVMEWIARIGYGAKGVVYGTVGLLAAIAVFGGSGGQTTGLVGAMGEFQRLPYGWVLLTLAALGLFCYVLWCLLRAFLRPEQIGAAASGVVKRVVGLVAAVIYGFLAFSIARVAMGVARADGKHAKDVMAADVMAYPAGRWILITLGAIVVGVGIAQFYLAWLERYKQRWRTQDMTPAQERWAGGIAKFGLGARGLVFLICGGFLVASGWQAEPDKATGLGGALGKLAQQSYGRGLLAVVAMGLVCYGAYCMIDAIYARINP